MSRLRAATLGATAASASFSSAIRTRKLAIRVGAAASTIVRCNRAGGKTRHVARRPHGRSGSFARRSDYGLDTSGQPRTADIIRSARLVRFVPEAAIPRRLISRFITRGIDLITIYPVSWRQRELKQCTLWLVFVRPQPSAVFFDDGAADRQSHAHAAGFCREEWLQQLLGFVRAHHGARIPRHA